MLYLEGRLEKLRMKNTIVGEWTESSSLLFLALVFGGPFKLSHPWVIWISYELYFLLVDWGFQADRWARARFDHTMTLIHG